LATAAAARCGQPLTEGPTLGNGLRERWRCKAVKDLRVSRREVLGGLLAAPLVSLSGCGDAGSTTAAAAPVVPGNAVPAASGPGTAGAVLSSIAGAVKPVFAYYVYDGDELQTVEDNLTTPMGVTTTADRFAQGALCYSFDGSGSNVVVDGVQSFPQGDFALLLWVKSSNQSSMGLLRINGGDSASGELEIGVSVAGVLSVSWGRNRFAIPPSGGSVPSLTDGSWHHITVQRYGSSLQFFVDGVARGAFVTSQPLPTKPTVLIGGSWQGAIDGVRLYNRAFPAQSIPRCVYQWTQVKPLTPTGNLAAYFPFNGSALNYLGYGVEGIPNNVIPTSDRYGSGAAAYLFNGTDSRITLNQGFNSTAAEFAIGFWEQAIAAAPMTALSASSGGVDGTSLDFVFNGNAALQIELDGVPLPALSVGTTGALTDGNWHFVFLQRAGSTLQLYVDGALAASADNTSLFFGSSSVVQFGRGSGASPAVANSWNGALDDVQFYEASLTPQQIVDLRGLEFLGRDGAGALSFQGKMWLLGGWNEAYVPVTNSEVWSSEDGVNWTLVTIAPWERRHAAGYAVFDNKMWIVGGDKNTGHYQNDVWSSADGVTWEKVTDSVPWANRASQYVLTFKDRLWLMGGQEMFEPSPPVVAYNDVWSSSDGANWQLETPHAAWSPRGLMMGNVVFQGRMWVIGGGQYDVRTFNNDVWSSADGVNWTQVLVAAPWSPRQYQNITVFDNKMWVLAGGDALSQGGLNDVWYSTDGVQWTQLAATPWIPRHAATAFALNNYLWLTCGSDASGDNDVWKMGYAL
jgi:Concanavalin A-like lectin/glucanases superfamily